MFFDRLPKNLFRPLASPNARNYAIALTALYDRLVADNAQEDCTPQEARKAIADTFAGTVVNIYWQEDEEEGAPDPQNLNEHALRAYNALLRTGWIREMEESGYRRITYMPLVTSNILKGIMASIDGTKGDVGATCQMIHNTLVEASRNPVENAPSIAAAARYAEQFCAGLKHLVASIREIAHDMLEQHQMSQIYRVFFEVFVDRILLNDYHKLKVADNPYRFRAKTITQINIILGDRNLLAQFQKGLSRHLEVDEATAKGQIESHFSSIIVSFNQMERLINRIDAFQQMMTQRAHEAMLYALKVPSNLSEDILATAKAVAHSSAVEAYPSPLYRDNLLGQTRHYDPPLKREAAQPLKLATTTISPEALARDRAKTAYLNRRKVDPVRTQQWLERTLGSKQRISTDEVEIGSLDDLIVFLQVRELIRGVLPEGHPLAPVLEHYRIESVPGETVNPYLISGKLLISRRPHA